MEQICLTAVFVKAAITINPILYVGQVLENQFQVWVFYPVRQTMSTQGIECLFP
jgi:hypothetical protein